MAARPEPTGVRFVLGNCTQSGREAELDAWYDAYAADCTRPGLLVNAARYEKRDSAGSSRDPRYAAVYDIVIPDPERAWPETKVHPSRRFQTGNALFSVVLRSTYRRIEPIFPVGSSPLPATITILLTDDVGDIAESEKRAEERMLRTLAHSGSTRATRYALVEGDPSPPGFLEIYESATDQAPMVELLETERATARFFGSFQRTFSHEI
jgi:hypothetical protein